MKKITLLAISILCSTLTPNIWGSSFSPDTQPSTAERKSLAISQKLTALSSDAAQAKLTSSQSYLDVLDVRHADLICLWSRVKNHLNEEFPSTAGAILLKIYTFIRPGQHEEIQGLLERRTRYQDLCSWLETMIAADLKMIHSIRLSINECLKYLPSQAESSASRAFKPASTPASKTILKACSDFEVRINAEETVFIQQRLSNLHTHYTAVNKFFYGSNAQLSPMVINCCKMELRATKVEFDTFAARLQTRSPKAEYPKLPTQTNATFRKK